MLSRVLISALIYGFIGWVVWAKAIQRELLDMNCPDGPDTTDRSICRDGNGKLWANWKVKDSDGVDGSLAKIRILNHNYDKAVIWRRSLIVAFGSALLVYLVSQQRFPTGFELLGSMVVIFMVVYIAHGFWKYHHDRFIEQAIDGHLKHLHQIFTRSDANVSNNYALGSSRNNSVSGQIRTQESLSNIDDSDLSPRRRRSSQARKRSKMA